MPSHYRLARSYRVEIKIQEPTLHHLVSGSWCIHISLSNFFFITLYFPNESSKILKFCCGKANRRWQTQSVVTLDQLCSVLMSEWLLFNTKWAIFQPYHGENKLHSMKWLWWFLLRTRPTCWIESLYSAGTLKQQFAGRHVAILWHIMWLVTNTIV
jgi:hypothetical protein